MDTRRSATGRGGRGGWIVGAAVAAIGLAWAGPGSAQAHPYGPGAYEIQRYAPARVYEVWFYDHRHDLWRVYGSYNHRDDAEQVARHIWRTRHRPTEIREIIR